MEKKITVHVVKVGDKTKLMPSAARAKELAEVLNEMLPEGIEAEVASEKRTIQL